MLNDVRKNVFRYWWISLIVGILSIAAGICCFATPLDSLAVLTVFFMVVLLLGGLFNIVFAVVNRASNGYWDWNLARGIIELLLAIWLFMLPVPLVTTSLVYIMGFWMMFHAVTGICESCTFASFPVKGWGWMLACNILSLICSFLFLVIPAFGGIFMLVYIGLSFILYGLFRCVLSFMLNKFNKTVKKHDDVEFVDAEVVDV